MNTQIFPQSEQKLKSFWNRPGGKFGTILGLGILGAIGYYVFPILKTIAWNTVSLGIAIGSVFLLWTLVTHPATKQLFMSIFYIYEILVKKFVGVWITLDPFIIAEDYIRDIEKEREVLYEKTLEVDAQKEEITAKIKERLNEKQKELDKAAAAKKLLDKEQNPFERAELEMMLANCTRQASRLDLYVKQLTPIEKNLQKIGDYLTQVHKNSKYMLEDMKNELAIKKDLYKSVTKGNNAVKSAFKIFAGNTEKKLMMEQSMEFLKQDISTKLASMKKAISYSSEFMKSIDLENASYQESGLRMLEEYKPELFTYKGHVSEKSSTSSPASAPSLSKYNNLLS